MKTTMFILTYVTLAILANGCGDSRTQAHLRSSEEIKVVTDTFAGTTSISDVLNALGPWQSAGRNGTVEYVAYWTNDGGETRVVFGTNCPSETQPGCFSEAKQVTH